MRKYAYRISKAYWRAAARADAKATARAERRAERQQPKPKVVLAERSHRGRKQHRLLTYRDAKRQQGRSKGGFAIAASGKAHRWTSAEASAAAKKGWRRKGRRWYGKRRIGRKLAKAAAVTVAQRELLRERHSKSEENGVRYQPSTGQWWRTYGAVSRVISEGHALRTLGYLPTKAGFVPIAWTAMGTGMKPAGDK